MTLADQHAAAFAQDGTIHEDLADWREQTQQAADATQNRAFSEVYNADGSITVIACAPVPRYEGDTVPVVTEYNEGFLALAGDGRLYRAWVTQRDNDARGPQDGAIVSAEWREITPDWTDRLGEVLTVEAKPSNTVRLGG